MPVTEHPIFYIKEILAGDLVLFSEQFKEIRNLELEINSVIDLVRVVVSILDASGCVFGRNYKCIVNALSVYESSGKSTGIYITCSV